MPAGTKPFNSGFFCVFFRKNLLASGTALHRLAPIMPKEKALQFFRKPPLRLNCAQAVAYGCGREDLLEELGNCGTGKAPGGLCGAIFCAMKIAGETDSKAVGEEFEKKLGACHCAKLKQDLHIPCPDCVACAVEIIEKRKH